MASSDIKCCYPVDILLGMKAKSLLHIHLSGFLVASVIFEVKLKS